MPITWVDFNIKWQGDFSPDAVARQSEAALGGTTRAMT